MSAPRGDAKSFTAMKLAALDRAMSDGRLTNLDFRLLYFLASVSDQETGIARRKQSVIADALNITRRTVQICVNRLCAAAYIMVTTKDGGTYTNGYALLIGEKANCSTSVNANLASPLPNKKRTEPVKKAKGIAEKDEPSFAPIFPFNSLEDPSMMHPIPDAVLSVLRKRLSEDVCRAWFNKVGLLSAIDGVVKLVAPTKFHADYITQQFEDHLHKAWRAAEPCVERVVMTFATVR